MSMPWYQIPPLDFVSENLWPGEIRDERVFSYQLVPQRLVPTEELLERADNLRGSTQTQPFVLPPDATPPPPPAVIQPVEPPDARSPWPPRQPSPPGRQGAPRVWPTP